MKEATSSAVNNTAVMVLIGRCQGLPFEMPLFINVSDLSRHSLHVFSLSPRHIWSHQAPGTHKGPSAPHRHPVPLHVVWPLAPKVSPVTLSGVGWSFDM